MKVAIISDIIDEGRPISMVRYTRALLEDFLETRRKLEFYLVHQVRNYYEPLYKRGKEIIVQPFINLDYVLNLPLVALRYVSKHRILLPSMRFLPIILRKFPFDIVHHPASWSNPALLGSKSKLVVTLHGVAIFVISPKVYFGEEKLATMYAATWRLLTKKINTIITVSKSEKRNISEYLRFPKEKIRVIYHGIEDKFRVLRKRDEIKKEVERRYGISSPFILHVSDCSPKKNVQMLIKAFHKAKQHGIKHKLVVVGEISNIKSILKYFREYRAFIQKNLYFLSGVPDYDLIKLYNAADSFLFPSLHESFGLPVIEAMACGCPVITSNVYSLPEIAGNAAVLVNPYDLNELSTEIGEVLTNEGLRVSLCRKGLRRARMFSWKKCATEHLKVYEEIYNE